MKQEPVPVVHVPVVHIENYGLYTTRQDGDNIIVKCDMGKGELILRGDADQQKFLGYLDDTYGEDIGVEALYDFNRAIEKDD